MNDFQVIEETRITEVLSDICNEEQAGEVLEHFGGELYGLTPRQILSKASSFLF